MERADDFVDGNGIIDGDVGSRSGDVVVHSVVGLSLDVKWMFGESVVCHCRTRLFG